MIASVTSVVRSGADLPTPVRASVPPSAGSTTTTRTSTTPEASTTAAPADTAAGAVEQAEQGQKATGEHAGRQQHADSPADVAATSRYVGELMAARITGGSVSSAAKPAHIAPERMAALVSFLEENSEPAVSAKADAEKQGVDVRS